jgi:hypothetical protein
VCGEGLDREGKTTIAKVKEMLRQWRENHMFKVVEMQGLRIRRDPVRYRSISSPLDDVLLDLAPLRWSGSGATGAGCSAPLRAGGARGGLGDGGQIN